jgi:long-subunit fatty acid transport protein
MMLISRRSALYTSVALFSVCNFSGAHADWAETLGMGQMSINLGGAVTATSNDYDAFYTNPAGAANFGSTFIGGSVKVLDVRELSVMQSDVASGTPSSLCRVLIQPCGASPKNGLSLSPQSTLPGSAVAVLPSFGAYTPLPGADKVVVGLGIGSPFNVSAVYGNTGVPGNYGQFNTTSAGLAIVEASPTIALKLTDRLNVGASVGFTTMKYLQIGSVSGAPSATLPGALGQLLGNIPLGAASIGTMNLQTGSNISVPGGPSFATGPIDIPSATFGAQYKLNDVLTGGVTYRTKTPETFTGVATLNVTPITSALGTTPAYSSGDRFTYKVELPADVQIGLAYDVTSRWKVMGDVRWTNWRDAKGWGTPGVISLQNGTINPGAAVAASTPGALLGIKSAPIQSITTGYNAHDTYSFHFGTSYKLTSNFEIQAGYVYDPSFISASSEDLTTLSSNRHIFSLGGTYTLPSSRGGEWAITAGAQIVDYEHRHIALGESSTLGGINGLQGVLNSSSNLRYSQNTLGGLDIGGYVWSAGASISYRF